MLRKVKDLHLGFDSIRREQTGTHKRLVTTATTKDLELKCDLIRSQLSDELTQHTDSIAEIRSLAKTSRYESE